MTATPAPLPFPPPLVSQPAEPHDRAAGERHGATWTPERLVALQQGLADGLSCARIARLIGVSRNAVIGKINRLGLARGRTPTVTMQRAVAPRGARLAEQREAPPRPRAPTQRQILRIVRAEPIEAPLAAGAEACSLVDLAPGQCRWPMGDGATLTFCGRARLGSLSYCGGHARLAYRPAARAG